MHQDLIWAPVRFLIWELDKLSGYKNQHTKVKSFIYTNDAKDELELVQSAQ